MANTYDIGDTVRLGNHAASGQSAFKNAAGADTDPTTIVLTVKAPDGTSTAYTYSATLTKEATGRFYVDYAITMSGIHTYRLVGTGTVPATVENYFNVRQSAVLGV